jgi:hypothetical protein
MRDARLYVLFILAVSLGAAEPAFGLRCKGQLIDVGDTKLEVSSACGEPASIERPGTVVIEHGGFYWPIAVDEEWVYNFGPQQFIRFVRFRGGRVVHIESGRHGWIGDGGC